MGFFSTFMSKFQATAKSENRSVTFAERAGASLAAGGLGAILGNPADLALIRMQSDGLAPASARKNYTSVLNALSRIAKSEGIFALWNGCLPTVARAMALNFGQLAFYSESKEQLKKMGVFKGMKGEEALRNLGASAVAGFFASFFSLPFDFVKTRLQKQTRAPDGTLPYRGTLHCAMKVAKEEGILRFYRGFGT
jgi:solute carrier family 25 oxoglutarate transporter 11